MPNSLFILFIVLILLTIFVGYFLLGSAPKPRQITWGVNFDQQHAADLGLDWKAVYLALLDDLQVRNIKLLSYWSLLEPQEDAYKFEDLDWQVSQAQSRGVQLILVIGMKTGRWPECHIPAWAQDIGKAAQQEAILSLLKELVLRYQSASVIKAWQVENEPLFPFGDCPWKDKNFLQKEIALVKSLDPQKRPVLITESGEASSWIDAAKTGDIVGATMYRKAWFQPLGLYIPYPLTPVFYWRKAQIIKKFFGKDVICVELQAEPWCPNQLYNCSLKEQAKTMNLARFKQNIDFAQKTGLKEFYLWGVEWIYWLKEKQNDPLIWQEAKQLFQ